MRTLDPLQPQQRLPTTYRKSELNTIASEANAHLERVERAIERERRLLDQASHEFRTPLAVISGAADVLHKQVLPERAQRPLQRIDEAVATLTQIMEALLYLSREPTPAEGREVTLLHGLLPDLVRDHLYLLAAKPVQCVVETLEPLTLRAPESMVRIAVGNLLRNAAEHTHEGAISVSLAGGRLCIRDSGAGFDTIQAAQRYTESLQQPGTQGGGSGLGLFLTRRICERFGWRLQLESSLTDGTSAVIVFGP
jgi:signal transduction histidine kinase